MADKTTSFFKGQMPVRAKGQTHCTFHREETFQLYCITCQELACITCVSTIHRRHDIDNLQELTPQKKVKIQNFIDTSEVVKRNEFQESLASVDKQLKKNADTFEKLSVAAQKQADQLKQDIDIHTAKTLSIFKQIEEENAQILKDYRKDICKTKEQFDNFLKECKQTLQNGSHIEVHDTEKEVHSLFTLPQRPAVQTVSFKQNLDPVQSIEHAFGMVTIGRKTSVDLLTGSSGPQHRQRFPGAVDMPSATAPASVLPQMRAKAVITKAASQKQWNDLVLPPVSPRQHITPAKLIASYNTRSPISSMSSIGENVWTCHGCLPSISFLNKKGDCIREVEMGYVVWDISVSPTTHNVWISTIDGNIMEVTPVETIHRLRSVVKVAHICITQDEHVLVAGRAESVTKFTTNGEIVLTRGSYVSASSMSECRITGNIAVVDNEDHVSVMNKTFHELFSYKGETGTDGRISKYKEVAFDSTGNLATCNGSNIDLLSHDGRLLWRLTSEELHISRINCICVDGGDTMWVGDGLYNVHLFQYKK